MIKKNIDTSILLAIYETSTQLLKKNLEWVEKEGLTNQQWVILIHLAKDPNLPYLKRNMHEKPLMASELADSLGVTRANVTNLLTPLINKGLISQDEDDKDRRKKRLALTKKGQKIIEKMQPARYASNTAMLRGLKKEEKQQLISCLEKITENIVK